MKKCVKKIPKYGNGIPGATAPSPQEQFKSMNARVGGPTSTSSNGNIAGGIAGAVGAASGAVANAFGIEQGKNAAIFNAVGDVASIIPGVGQFLGPALKTVGAFAGEGGGVDQNTGEVTKSSGLTRVFGWGRDDKAMAQESNRIKMANASRTLTENLRTDYYNNTRGAGSINVLAAEGGIMRQPVDALVSKGELIYNPVTQKLSQVPGSKGKPNKADDVYAKLYEGDVVISNSPTMLMANGKTPAQNLMGMVDKYATGGTVKAREAIIKKVVNWQEANKTKPQEYAMYDEGTGKDGAQATETKKAKVRKKEKVKYVVWNGRFGYFDVEGGFHDMSDVSNANLPDSNYLGRYEWVDVPIEKVKSNDTPKGQDTDKEVKKSPIPAEVVEEPTISNVGKHTSDVLNFNTDRHTRDGVNDKKPESNWRKSPTQEEINDFYGYGHKKVSETVAKDRSERINNKNRKYLIENESEMAGSIPEIVVTGKKPTKKGNVVTNKNTKGVSTTSTPISVTGTIENLILPEYDRLSFAEPFQFNNQHLRYAPGNYVPIKPLNIEVEDEVVDEIGLPKDKSKSNINWDDLAYKAAVLTQPLWGRAKAEPVNYTLRNAKYIPVGANVKPLHRQADETYSMGRYNFANLGGNTGANMAYGAQLAANRAKQYADAYQWQQNVQNDQIAKNIGIYSDWDTQRTEILNNVYDKNAANRATARNINRQNATTALKSWGQILRDNNLSDVQKATLNMYAPAIAAVMENPYSVLNPLYNLNR